MFGFLKAKQNPMVVEEAVGDMSIVLMKYGYNPNEAQMLSRKFWASNRIRDVV
jgi:hypothetical protein